MQRRQVLKGMAAGLSVGVASPAVLRAQSQVYQLSSWLPPSSLIVPNFIDVWREQIAIRTDGRVQVEMLPKPLGPPNAHLGLLEQNEVDFAYCVHGYTQEKFPRAQIGQFSFLGDAFSVSQAFSKVYGDTLNATEEHQAVELLALFQHGPGVLMMKDKKITKPSDFEGLRLRTAGGYIGFLLKDLGTENLRLSPFAVADALESGEIDGVAFPYEAAPAFGVDKKVSYISELPGGYYNTSFFLGMSPATAGRMAPNDLAIVREYSKTTAPVLAAKSFDFADYLARKAMIESGVEIAPANDAIINLIQNAAQAYESKWDLQMQAQGYDGAYALAQTRELTSS